MFFWGLDQQEREYAINEYKSLRADVLVATDIAGKGLGNQKHTFFFKKVTPCHLLYVYYGVDFGTM